MPGYEIRNDLIESALREMADALKLHVPKGWGFTLLLFNVGEATDAGQGMFYISTANREDMVAAMQEFLGRQGPS